MATTAAQTAKAIRTELKSVFPGTKFSVTSENFSMGNAVRIKWTYGPTDDEVKSVTDKYQYGHFNSMEDMYEMSNCSEDLPQVKFVTTRREYSEEAINEVMAELEITEDQKNEYNERFQSYNNELIYRKLNKRSYLPETAENKLESVEIKGKKSILEIADEIHETVFGVLTCPTIKSIKATTDCGRVGFEPAKFQVNDQGFAYKNGKLFGKVEKVSHKSDRWILQVKCISENKYINGQEMKIEVFK